MERLSPQDLAQQRIVHDHAAETGVFLNLGLFQQIALDLAGDLPLVSLPLHQINPQSLAKLRVALAGCPLIGPEFDCLQVIDTLSGAGFSGPLLVIAPHLPKAALVEAELKARQPGFSLRLITP